MTLRMPAAHCNDLLTRSNADGNTDDGYDSDVEDDMQETPPQELYNTELDRETLDIRSTTHINSYYIKHTFSQDGVLNRDALERGRREDASPPPRSTSR